MARILVKLFGNKSSQKPIELPIALMRLHGSFAFAGGWNPFVAGIAQGETMLAEFYSRFRPQNLREFHLLQPKGAAGEDLQPWVLPWLAWESQRPPSAEGGLDPAIHGVSYYGPCSPEKTAFEHKRLVTLRDAIEAKGYQPDKFSHIQGFMMLRGAEIRYFVRGGKHRAAVMASLGHRTLPVTFKPGWPGVVNRDDADRWPLVTEGRIDAGLARAVFDHYFDMDGSQQAKQLGLI